MSSNIDGLAVEVPKPNDDNTHKLRRKISLQELSKKIDTPITDDDTSNEADLLTKIADNIYEKYKKKRMSDFSINTNGIKKSNSISNININKNMGSIDEYKDEKEYTPTVNVMNVNKVNYNISNKASSVEPVLMSEINSNKRKRKKKSVKWQNIKSPITDDYVNGRSLKNRSKKVSDINVNNKVYKMRKSLSYLSKKMQRNLRIANETARYDNDNSDDAFIGTISSKGRKQGIDDSIDIIKSIIDLNNDKTNRDVIINNNYQILLKDVLRHLQLISMDVTLHEFREYNNVLIKKFDAGGNKSKINTNKNAINSNNTSDTDNEFSPISEQEPESTDNNTDDCDMDNNGSNQTTNDGVFEIY